MPESAGAETGDRAGAGRHARLTTRTATAADLKEHYPDFTCSFRAWVAELDGAPKAMIGVALTLPVAFLFSRFEPEFRPHLRRLGAMKLIRAAREACRASSVPVWTIAQRDEPDAPRILERLGFRLLGEAMGEVIYEFVPGE
jgi:hypothetical protein